jgi:hypothetical protein
MFGSTASGADALPTPVTAATRARAHLHYRRAAELYVTVYRDGVFSFLFSSAPACCVFRARRHSHAHHASTSQTFFLFYFNFFPYSPVPRRCAIAACIGSVAPVKRFSQQMLRRKSDRPGI